LPKVSVYVTLKPTLLDAQGRTVENALKSLGYGEIADVRVGKVIEIQMAETDPDRIHAQVATMCDKLLANPVMEDYRIEVRD
jgi:phosphoribosylformylglycinamidine synthase subunit PurS